MLILSRRSGESIIVDEKVTLTVLSIKGRQVRIGIDAPDDISVHREEIYKKIRAGESTGLKSAGDASSSAGESSADNPKELKASKDEAPVVATVTTLPLD